MASASVRGGAPRYWAAVSAPRGGPPWERGSDGHRLTVGRARLRVSAKVGHVASATVPIRMSAILGSRPRYLDTP